MGPAPSLATYEAQATAEYAPQEAAEQTQDAATHQANLNTLGTQLGSVGTQYDEQEQALTSTVQSESAQIAQTYATHLLGNFSGLQGNDMGEMFSKANLQEQDIETQRTNAVNAVNTAITNENLTYNADVASLGSKYQGLESGAASDAYNSAEKDYETQEYQQEELGLEYAKLSETTSNDAATQQNNYLSQFKATEKSGGVGYAYTGPNGESLDLGQYATALAGGNTDNALSIAENQLSQSQTSYDKSALGYIGTLQKQGKSSSDILDAVSKKYSLDFSGV